MSQYLLPPELLWIWLVSVGMSAIFSVWTYLNWDKIPADKRGIMILINVNSYFVEIVLYVLLKIYVA